jgi:hypothetical protein
VRNSNQTQYGTPNRKGVPVRSTQGRKCSFPGCGTVLSIYNAATECFLHSPSTKRHPLASS